MCRVLAYIGPEIPLENLLLKPENSLINQTLDPERHPQLQLAGWGFGAWSEHFLNPDKPFVYHRPMAAFYDDNVTKIVPHLRANTMLAHVRAGDANEEAVLADENCHPFAYKGTRWLIAQNGELPHWKILQRELLQHCKDEYLEQMSGTTDTEFLYVLLLSLLEGDSNQEVQRAFEEMLTLIVQAMKALDYVALTKLKLALVSPNRIVGVNVGAGHQGETAPVGDWRELRKAEPGTDDFALGMLLEPMYMLLGRDFQDRGTYEFEQCTLEQATSAIFASEPLTENADDWVELEYGDIVFLEKDGENITRTVNRLQV